MTKIQIKNVAIATVVFTSIGLIAMVVLIQTGILQAAGN